MIATTPTSNPIHHPEREIGAKTTRDRLTKVQEDLARATEDLDRIRRQLDTFERRPAANPDLGRPPPAPAPGRGLSL